MSLVIRGFNVKRQVLFLSFIMSKSFCPIIIVITIETRGQEGIDRRKGLKRWVR